MCMPKEFIKINTQSRSFGTAANVRQIKALAWRSKCALKQANTIIKGSADPQPNNKQQANTVKLTVKLKKRDEPTCVGLPDVLRCGQAGRGLLHAASTQKCDPGSSSCVSNKETPFSVMTGAPTCERRELKATMTYQAAEGHAAANTISNHGSSTTTQVEAIRSGSLCQRQVRWVSKTGSGGWDRQNKTGSRHPRS